MAGKQKYGRGISLGLLDVNSCNLARELKSDPDTSIGDEIQRIILTKNESYALVACTEHTSTYTCFVVFKLEIAASINNEQGLSIPGSMCNCTMVLTRFNCNPDNTFSINDDEQVLTVLHTNQILIWKLNDGEISFNYDFHHLNTDCKIQQIVNCQMNNNRLLILVEQGSIYIWDVTVVTGQFSLIATFFDPLVSYYKRRVGFSIGLML
jgi:WD40 repeat protein